MLRNIFTQLFSEVRTGTLDRLPFLAMIVVLTMSVILFALASVLLIGIGEHLVSGDIHQAQETIREWLSIPYIIVFAIVAVLVSFAQANVTAKRIRNIGLPGWRGLLAVVIVNVFVSYFFSTATVVLLQSCFYLAIAALPKNTIK